MRTRGLFCLFILALVPQLCLSQDEKPLGDVARQTRGAAKSRTAPSETVALPQSQGLGSNQAVPASAATIDPAKTADIRRLLEVAGAKALVTQSMTGMEKNIRPMLLSSLPPGEYRDQLIDLFFAKFHSKLDTQKLLDMAVPAYDKYLSHEEIKGLLRFYETPLGQKALTVMPKLMGELQEAGQKWGGELGRTSMMEVLAEHPELAKALEEAKKTTPSQ
jgi:hypothetical protein